MAGIRYKGQIFSGAASFGSADEVSVNDGSGQVTDTQTIISRILGDFAEIESSATASKAYAVGDYLVLNGYFYKVTASIAIDDELVEGTNIEKTTVGAATAWANITGKPSTFTPSSHTHDDRYYTESEIGTLLNTVTSAAVSVKKSLGSNGELKVWKLGKMLYVSARTFNTSTATNVSASTVVFKLPSGYTPSGTRLVPAILAISSYSAISTLGFMSVNASGDMTVPNGTNYYQIWAVGAFPM